jgi:microcystin-dependent protein
MGTTPNLGLRYPEETDIPDVATDIKELALDVDSAVSAAPGTVLGSIVEWPWAASQIPAWALLPYGQLLTAAAYPALQVLADNSGRPNGGSAGVNFNMPDYRGRIGVGKDDMGGTDSGRITVAISGIDGQTVGAVFGAEGITLTSAQIPAHSHPHALTLPNHVHADSGHTHTVPIPYAGSNVPDGSKNVYAFQSQSYTTSVGYANIGNPTTLPAIGGSISNSTGGGGAHQNAQPSIIVNVFMRVI